VLFGSVGVNANVTEQLYLCLMQIQMKHNLLFLLFFLPLTSVFSQGLIPFRKDSLYGYMDYKGNIVAQPQYQEADFLDIDSLANVKKNNKWSLINQNGIEVLPFVGTSRLEVYPLRNHKEYNDALKNFVSISKKNLHFLRTVKVSAYEYFILNLKTAKSYGMFKFDYNDYPLPFSHSDETYIPIFQNNVLIAESETHNCTIFDTLTNILIPNATKARVLNHRFVSYYQKEQLFLYDTQTKQALKLPYQSIRVTTANNVA
jgi:WG containing repeat